MKKFSDGNTWEDRELFHGDYFLANGTGWFHSKDFSVRIICSENSCLTEVFDRTGDTPLFSNTTYLKEIA
jgi:hypothetical protein